MSRPAFTKAFAALVAGAFFLVLYLASAGGMRIHSLQGSTMGTSWQVQISTDADADAVQALGNELQVLLEHLDRAVFTTWSPDSELMRLNASAAGQRIPVSAELMTVLQLSVRLYEETQHAFDVSIGELVNLWGFGPRLAGSGMPVNTVPDARSIATAMDQPGIAGLTLDAGAGTVMHQGHLALDLSGIAKGHAVDRLAETLLAAGHESFIAEIGGEIRVQGTRPDGAPWIIAVEKPQTGPRGVYATLNSRGEALALAGSGDYRNYREVAGRRYSHEIDPRSGYPASHALAAVTVISATAAEADGWATALMVLGPDEGYALAIARNLAAYFIMRAPAGLQSRSTPAFERYLHEDQGTAHDQKQF